MYVDAAGLWWKLKGRSIIEAVLNIILNFILVQVLGLPGVIIATIVSMLLINYLWGSEVVFTHYFQNGGLKTFFGDNLIYVIATVLCCVVPYVLLSLIPVSPLGKLIAGAALAITLSAGLWVLLFSRSKRLRAALDFLKFLKA